MVQTTADAALLRVLDTARAFLACRDQVQDIVSGRAPPARNLGEAIDRDFLFFDLERAAQALREAVAEVPQDSATPARRRA
jgi:hypothetical protein